MSSQIPGCWRDRQRAFVVIVATFLAGVLTGPPEAFAQTFEVVGTRALGMGGAFVAVADDATAPYWNPAGLALGPAVDLVLERQGMDTLPGGRNRPIEPATRAMRGSSALLGLGTPPLGLTYYRIRTTILAAGPAALLAGDRQNVSSSETVVNTLVTQHFGVTLVQSVARHIMLGTTLKIVRGTAGQGFLTRQTVKEALDAGGDIKGEAQTKADLDAGLLAGAGVWRVGIVGRNLREPEFEVLAPDEPAAEPARLARQLRAGVAFAPRSRPTGTNGPLTVAADMDLTVAKTVFGRRREMAIGGETWWFAGRAAIRGGFRFNTLKIERQGRNPVFSGGFSLSVKRGALIEGQVFRGRNGEEQGWGLTARLTF